MNAPLVWIGLPTLFSIALLLLLRWRKVAALSGSIFALGLASAAWALPVGERVQVGVLSFEIEASWLLFGRSFILESSDRPLVILLNLAIALWFVGTLSSEVHPFFFPLGMGLSVALIAAVLIQPLYYGAILVQLAAVISLLLFVSDYPEIDLGIKRFWVFQSLAMPPLLFAGWLLEGNEASPDAIPSLSLLIPLLLGYSLLLSGVPFQSWLPAVAQHANPFSFAFTLFVASFTTVLFAFSLVREFAWLVSSPWIIAFFSLQGLMMSLIGGLGALYHRHLGRFLGYILVKELGFNFLILGLGLLSSEKSPLLALLFLQALPRGLALALLTFASNIYRDQKGSLSIQDLVGIGRQYPLATFAYFVAVLTLAGFPLTAAFPTHLPIWQGWFERFPPIAFSAVFGSIGVMIGGLRTLAALIRSTGEPGWVSSELHGQRVLLTVGGLGLLLAGIFPQWFFPLLFQMGLTFLQGG
ncbi:MAG: proton-conducting transporter membrane subunit [Anaerolineales bacterium]|nr:hypothetical protein [Anaerolineales bacterium]MDW8448271.1 proton-conducting transporter membrane subunit [Anaerolineales bacterium]